MQAVILAGGLGTRLKPLFKDLPKSMAPIGNRPFLEILLTQLKKQGIRDILLCLGYKGEIIKGHFGAGKKHGLRIDYSIEQTPLGTAGAIALAEPYLAKTFFLLNGDSFLEINYNKLAEFHRKEEALVTLTAKYVYNTKRYGLLEINSSNRLVGFKEKQIATGGYINTGVYVMNKEILHYIPKNRTVSLEKNILPKLISAGESIFVYKADAFFIDIGTPESYRDAERILTAKNLF
jgi:NDP-sugar pyrophosphorylase family protein